MRVSVIIVSAGKSTRMGGINKQFLELSGIPVLIRSIMAFDEIENVSEIIVVTNKDSVSETEKMIEGFSFKKPIKVTDGGETRQQSVFNGFRLVSDDSDFVTIHDGARPLVSENAIKCVIKDAQAHGASTLGVPVKDTIKVVENGFISDTPERSKLFIAQTPQTFEKALYKKGIENALENSMDFTDDCQLIEAIGVKVFMTIGDYSNIKITTPEDIRLAEFFLSERND